MNSAVRLAEEAVRLAEEAVRLAEETVICRSFVQPELISLATPAPTPKDQRNVSSRMGFLPSKLLGAKATIDDAYQASNGVIHSFVRGLTCRHDRRMLYKLYSIVFNMPSGMRSFFVETP